MRQPNFAGSFHAQLVLLYASLRRLKPEQRKMCGLAGIFYAAADTQPPPAQIKAMTDAIAHRGPDGEGFHLAPGIALGHRRLAIIDPLGGAQPMYNEDRSVAIVFNGEIYNFETLRDDLCSPTAAIPRRSCMPGKVTANAAWIIFPACSPLRCGMRASKNCSARATG
jgi:hypothetical protein